MKIALVSPYDHSVAGGVGAHIAGLEKEFCALGHQVKILAPASDDTKVGENVMIVSDRVVPVGISGSKARITLSLSLYRRIKRILHDEQFDVVHIHEPLVPMLPVFVLRHAHGVTIGTFHAYRDNDSYMGYAATRPVLQRLMSRLDARTCVSRPVVEFVSRYFPATYEIIPNGLDIERFGDPSIAPIEKYMDGKLNILFVGRLEKRKGFPHLLAAYPQIKEQVPDARLLVVGAYDKDDREQFVHYARDNGLRDVRFVGYVAADELPRYYRTAHVFCAPSTGFESFGYVLVEALAAGAPLVASDITGYRSVITHGVDGLLTPPGDEPALAQMITLLLRDPALRARLSAQGRETVKQYSWKNVAQRTLELYERCIEAREQKAPEAHRSRFSLGRPRRNGGAR
ncbi:MAG: glycosyltransferase family 4 protein [Chloroflexi bacterium]|nr:glycosyltransferase family 4 protein [Chloroflexota bacterium]